MVVESPGHHGTERLRVDGIGRRRATDRRPLPHGCVHSRDRQHVEVRAELKQASLGRLALWDLRAVSTRVRWTYRLNQHRRPMHVYTVDGRITVVTNVQNTFIYVL